MFTPWLAGLDVGQTHDPSALVLAERQLMQWGTAQEQRYAVRHIERFALQTPYVKFCRHGTAYGTACAPCPTGTSIGGLIEQVQTRLALVPKPRGWDAMQPPGADGVPLVQPYTLIVDGTGVGRGVVDAFRVVLPSLVMIVLTGGHTVHSPSRYEHHVPKTTVIGALQVVVQSRRIQVARGLPDAETLIQEAQNFRYTIRQDGRDVYDLWRENVHDDIVFAAAMAIWYGEQFRPMSQTRPPQAKAIPTGNVLVRR